MTRAAILLALAVALTACGPDQLPALRDHVRELAA